MRKYYERFLRGIRRHARQPKLRWSARVSRFISGWRAFGLAIPATAALALAAPTTAEAACGDRVIDGADECDDGDLVSGDGCSSTCRIEDGFV